MTVPQEGYEDTICHSQNASRPVVEKAISEAVEHGFIWLINGPASILGEQVPAGVLGPSATLNAPSESR